MDGENNGKPYQNGWFGGKTHHFRKHPYGFNGPDSSGSNFDGNRSHWFETGPLVSELDLIFTPEDWGEMGSNVTVFFICF